MFHERQCSSAYLDVNTHSYCKSVITSRQEKHCYRLIICCQNSSWAESVMLVKILKAFEHWYIWLTGKYAKILLNQQKPLERVHCFFLEEWTTLLSVAAKWIITWEELQKRHQEVLRLNISNWICPSGFLFPLSYISTSQKPLCIIASRVIFA